MNVHPKNPSPPDTALRVALAHDWLVGYRGGEAVLERIAALVSDRAELTALYTMFDDGSPLSTTIDALRARAQIHASVLNPGLAVRRWLLPLYTLGVRDLSRRFQRQVGDDEQGPPQLLISTSSAAILGLRAPHGVPHLCYCHSPARYLWSQVDQYRGGLRGRALNVLGPMLRRADRQASDSVTSFLANSTATQRLIRECYQRDAVVVFPPVRTDYFTPLESAPDDSPAREPFLLVANALEPYKRTDLAIRAALHMNRRLVIAGDGSQHRELRSMANNSPLIEFVGRVSHERLRDLYRCATALLYPQIEDFGITAVEAQACGTPVVGIRAGGVLDSVIDGVTGSLASEQTVDSLCAAIAVCSSKPAATQACRGNALRFSVEAFDRTMTFAIDAMLGTSQGSSGSAARPVVAGVG